MEHHTNGTNGTNGTRGGLGETVDPEKLRQARERMGLSQAKLGELVGVSGPQVSRWERQPVIPRRRSTLTRLASVLQMEIPALMTHVEPAANVTPLDMRAAARKGGTSKKRGKMTYEVVPVALYGSLPPDGKIGDTGVTVPKTAEELAGASNVIAVPITDTRPDLELLRDELGYVDCDDRHNLVAGEIYCYEQAGVYVFERAPHWGRVIGRLIGNGYYRRRRPI